MTVGVALRGHPSDHQFDAKERVATEGHPYSYVQSLHYLYEKIPKRCIAAALCILFH